MRIAVVVIGVLLILIGLVWIGQGLGFVKGSVMTGQIVWTVIGIGVAIAGAGLAVFGIRRPVRPVDR